MATDDPKTITKDKLDSALKKASTVVEAYGVILGAEGEPGILLHPESELPFTKAHIRQSIELLLFVPTTDDAMRDNLEAMDVLLSDFVPDEDYSVVHQQRVGLSQALKTISSGGKIDGLQLAKTMGEGVTQEGEARLRQIEERVRRENQTTLERHRELRREADQLRKGIV
jgi:hypothetical protein